MSGRDGLHIVMYPWYGLSHLTSFLRLANKLAQRGHKISFFLPTKTQPKLAPLNRYPHLITFFPITVPAVDGLPLGAETPQDVPESDWPLLWSALDLTKDTMDSYLAQLKPHFVFCDFAYWLHALARIHGAKSIYYATSSLVPYAYFSRVVTQQPQQCSCNTVTEPQVLRPPPGFPCPEMVLQPGEVRTLLASVTRKSPDLQNGVEAREEGMSLTQRVSTSFKECDAVASTTCSELEGPFCEYLAKRQGRPVLLAGPLLPEPPTSKLEERFDSWLKGFSNASVIYCALGSECILTKDRFQELVLGLELTGKPFLAVLKPPMECETIDSALPEGFLERTKGRGIVHNGWVQQPLILRHPAIGCFVTHCGSGSLSEAILSESGLVLLPQGVDQFINARLMSIYLRVGVEVEKREEDCSFTREDVCKAIEIVLDVEIGVGKEVKANHQKWRNLLLKEGLEDSYIDEFTKKLRLLLV